MSSAVSEAGTLVRSYLFLRRAIGVIGMVLPFVLVIGKELLDGGGLLYSISGYYYSDMRGVLVGSMCAVGVFLFCYRGPTPLDDLASNIAGVAAVGVALFPTSPDDPTATQRLVGIVHLVAAGVFFLTLAYFCLVLFRRTGPGEPTRRKLLRNLVYLVCGIVILASIALIAVFGTVIDAPALHPALWLESAATLAFGVAWFTKGEAILADLHPEPATAAATEPKAA